MSRPALLIALFLAFVLALTWALTTSPLGVPLVPEPGAPFTPDVEPDDVTEIRWDTAEPPFSLQRRSDGEWELRTDDVDDAPWRIDRAPIDGALAALCATTFTPSQSADERAAEGIRLQLHSWRRSVAFSALPPVAGRTPVFVDPPSRWCTAPSDTFTALTPDAVLALRSRAALPGASVNAARITIRPPASESIVLWREGARWWLASPTDAPANDETVQRLLSTLASLRFASLRPAGDTSHETDTTAIAVTLETTQFDANKGISYLDAESVFLRVPTSARGALHAARTPDGPTYPLEQNSLATIPLDPTALIHPCATPTPPHDVAAITIDFINPPLTRNLRRNIDGWTISERLPDESESATLAADEAEISLLLQFLLNSPAERIRIEHPDPGEQPVARITLLDVSDHAIDELTLVRVPDASELAATRSDKVLRVYPATTTVPAFLTP